jgi:hypothetical protein
MLAIILVARRTSLLVWLGNPFQNAWGGNSSSTIVMVPVAI